jgi:two-component system sensor histidine kinase RegB
LVQERLTAARRRRLVVTVDPETPSPAATGAEMVQAIASLLGNAFDASGDADRVVLRFGTRGPMVRIEVQDRGTGMSPDARRRAGEPFYTTKEPGRGLGLGLFSGSHLRGTRRWEPGVPGHRGYHGNSRGSCCGQRGGLLT